MKLRIFPCSPRIRIAAAAVLAVFLSFAGPPRASAQSYVAIHSFQLSEANNSHARLVQDSGGFLYGTAPNGGANGVGSVFKMDNQGNNFLVLHDFNTTDGANPYSGLILAGDGFLYGTTQMGGIADGVIFKIDTNGNNFSVLHSLDGVNEGGDGFGGVVISGTTLYGVARDHGANNYGTIFKIDTDGMNYNVIYIFGSGTTDGSHPYGGLLLASDGRLYGTTEQGHNGTGLGTVFGVDTAGTNFLTLHTFTGGNDGQDPKARLIEGTDGFLYGTTVLGGSGSNGTAYKLRKDSSSYSVFHAFSSTDGTAPNAALTQIPGGLIYGTATNSGGSGGGTLFHMTTAGLLFHADHDFANASGSSPYGAPLFGLDSALYGTTSDGGLNSVGVTYQFTIPTLTSISPDSGPAAGGDAVTITGTGFVNGATATFGGSLAVVDSVTTTQVATHSPALSPGTLNDVVVGNPDSTVAMLEKAWLADFTDVPQSEPFHDYIEKIFRHGITAGIGGGLYGINNPNTRAQMAVFLLKAEHGSLYGPPPCTGIFVDVECTPVPAFAVDWIEQLSIEAITGGCTDSVHYCPDQPIPRSQMAVFLLKGSLGSAYVPPACTSHFNDVPCPATPQFPYSDWVEDLFNRGITAGCTSDPPFTPPVYCPDQTVSRGQMAVFLVKAFALP